MERKELSPKDAELQGFIIGILVMVCAAVLTLLMVLQIMGKL